MSRSEQFFERLRRRAVEEEERKVFAKYGDDPQDAVPEGHEPRPAAVVFEPSTGARDRISGIVEPNMQWVRDMVRLMSAEQLTILISLVFTQIRESGYTLSAPIDSVLSGQPPAWRILDAERKQVGAVRWVNGEWTTEVRDRG